MSSAVAAKVPVKFSAHIQRIVGTTVATRTDAVKALWAYIKEHKLQDATAKTTINCDPLMKEVFGRDSFKQTEIFSLLAQHVEKAPKAPKEPKAPKAPKEAKEPKMV